jgi:hypothetical protein
VIPSSSQPLFVQCFQQTAQFCGRHGWRKLGTETEPTIGSLGVIANPKHLSSAGTFNSDVVCQPDSLDEILLLAVRNGNLTFNLPYNERDTIILVPIRDSFA